MLSPIFSTTFLTALSSILYISCGSISSNSTSHFTIVSLSMSQTLPSTGFALDGKNSTQNSKLLI
ncbi:hypothetical protein CFC21_044093 [Triticum aestivum]|uniref:Secreted protein n=2 Tax=Triticum aestivum TaxID=4565 RepID=A0A3B6FXB9_WHEAT|nr:hypothetical protein CFC21_044093 [Triticum aestivum]